MRRTLAVAVKYLSKRLIQHVPSHALRLAWYRHVLGWRVGTRTTILMGQHLQMAGVRGAGQRVSIGDGTVINEGCFLQTGGGLFIGDGVSISAGAWLVTGSHDMD